MNTGCQGLAEFRPVAGEPSNDAAGEAESDTRLRKTQRGWAQRGPPCDVQVGNAEADGSGGWRTAYWS